MKLQVILLLSLVLTFSCTSPTAKKQTSEATSADSTVVKIAEEAFVYGMPLVLMDLTMKKMTNVAHPVNGIAAPINQFYISTEFPDASFRAVVKPNADTYYNAAWLDLSKEPMVLTLADAHNKYYLMPMLDAYTNVFASPGKRTTGTDKQTYLITGPNWQGNIPEGLKEIKSPTNLVWIVGRYQVNNPEDGEKNIVPIEKQNTLIPLSSYGKPYEAPIGKVDANLSEMEPPVKLAKMSIADFFNYVNKLLIDNPPSNDDNEVIEHFKKIGVGAGMEFSMQNFDSITQETLKNIPLNVINKIKETVSKGIVKPINGWSLAFKGFGDYKTNYQLRAAVALIGLGANLPEDAVYPLCSKDLEGNLLNGNNNYVIKFEKEQIPPVHAFWSLSMYDNEGYFVENPINRFTIGDRDKLKFNNDGSLELYIQNESPGKEKESNWLPSPKGNFELVLRLYWPKQEVLDGKWNPAGVQKISEK